MLLASEARAVWPRAAKLDLQIASKNLISEDSKPRRRWPKTQAPPATALHSNAERKPLPAYLPRDERILRPDLDVYPDGGDECIAWTNMLVPRLPAPAAIESCRRQRPAVLSNVAWLDRVFWHVRW